jgi:LuxR family maltose regulon positive regulatory protein
VTTPVLATKLYIPPTRTQLVFRPRLIERLNQGLQRKLTLISAPAGFGKTTLLSEWVDDLRVDIAHESKIVNRVAWLSLDEGDSDPARFLTYLVAALQTVVKNIGEGISSALQAPQSPPVELILTTLLNEITKIPDHFTLILDDYHVVDAKPVDRAIAFLIEHQPPQMHLIIATREDPDLPLARLRAQGQLNELRVTDLRFTPSEAVEFLNRVMGLNLSAEDVAALEIRTEGWIAGLQLAALALQGTIATQGPQDANSFIKSFTGSHHFIMDYLVEEVLQQQSERVQTFLLYTSILGRLCGSLCDAVMLDASASGQATLEYLERANLFLVPLDNARRWYRYHHLFADLLRQRLYQRLTSSTGDAEKPLSELHIRASQWYEDNGLQLEAFRHAAAAHDIERAEQLIDGKGIPFHFSGGVAPILDWLESLPAPVLNARPSLWWRHAALLLINGQTIGVTEKLQAAEAALEASGLSGPDADEDTRNLIGQIAAARSTLALTRYDIEGMLTQSRRALEYLRHDTMFTRATAYWTQGYAYYLLGDRTAARQALTESISLSEKSGAIFTAVLATIGLGLVQEGENQLHQALETYRRVLQWVGDHPQQIIHEVHLGLARIFYEWNDLDAAEQHGEESLKLAQQYERVIDRFIICEVFLARLKLARGDVAGAATMLAKTSQSARQQNFVHRIPEIVAAQVLTMLRQGNLAEAVHLAQTHRLPLSQARVHLAQGNPSAALTVLETWRGQVEAKDLKDERLKVMILQSLAFRAHDEKDKAVQLLCEALAFAEPSGFIRTFIDEGVPMTQLLSEVSAQGIMPDYTGKLLAAFEAEKQTTEGKFSTPIQLLVEPLSPRELEVLRLIAQGLSNDEIGKRLFLALDTVKGHNRRIYDKLQVQRRTEAVARARELGLL